MRPRIRVSLQEATVELCPPELYTFSEAGQFTRHILDQDQPCLTSLSINRPVSFKEIEPNFFDKNCKKSEKTSLIENLTSKERNGWVPLKRSPQFVFMKSLINYEDTLKIKALTYQEFEEEKIMPAFTVHYSPNLNSPNRLQQAMDACIYNTKAKTPQVQPIQMRNINLNENAYV